MTLKIAFATDDGKNFIDRHFGDAKFYEIYKISDSEIELISRIENTSPEEKKHADENKANKIVEILKRQNVKVVVSKVFGPNLYRIKKKFVCVIVDDEKIENVANTIQTKINLLNAEWEKGEERTYINFRKLKSES